MIKWIIQFVKMVLITFGVLALYVLGVLLFSGETLTGDVCVLLLGTFIVSFIAGSMVEIIKLILKVCNSIRG